MNNDRLDRGLSSHILPTSATMLGVCLMVISIVRLVEANTVMATIVDNIVAVDSMLFLAAALMSCLSIRSPLGNGKLEAYADVVSTIGLVVMVATRFMLAWEFGQV